MAHLCAKEDYVFAYYLGYAIRAIAIMWLVALALIALYEIGRSIM